MIREKEEKAALERTAKMGKEGSTINNNINTNTTGLTNSRLNDQTNQRRNYNNTSAENTMSKNTISSP